MAAARVATFTHGGDRKSDQAANWPEVSQDDAASMLNVGERSLRRAKIVQAAGVPKLVHHVIQLNASRRHLSESQRAMAAARVANMRQGARTGIASDDAKLDQFDAAALLNVGRASVQRAKAAARVATLGLGSNQYATVGASIDAPSQDEAGLRQKRGGDRKSKFRDGTLIPLADLEITRDLNRRHNLVRTECCHQTAAQSRSLVCSAAVATPRD